jgi:hypothetical protein
MVNQLSYPLLSVSTDLEINDSTLPEVYQQIVEEPSLCTNILFAGENKHFV